jgi:hypothetical protein
VDLDHNPLKKQTRKPVSRTGKKGKRHDLEDAGEISAEETDEDNLDNNPPQNEETKEAA